MAGDWIKMSTGLRSHPKVVRISSALHADRLRVVGGLWAVWCVFDEHSEDGCLEGYTLASMDEEIGWQGFGAAMQAVGWLEETDSGLHAPSYESHNGPVAKRRAMDASRKGATRKLSASEADTERTNCGQMSASDADKVRNREEKRREEEIQVPPTEVLVVEPSAPRPPACPTEALIALYHEHLPMLPRVEVVNDGRKRALSARWREVVTDPDIRKAEDPRAAGIDWFGWFFAHAASSKFLTGKAKDWRADFDFLVTPSKFAKVVEGSYHREIA